MNKIILMGRLTRDPEVRYSDDNKAVGRFALAVDRKFKKDGGPTADFFNCTAFGKTAEFVEKYLKKGTKILLTGSIQNDNYTNGHGEQVYAMQVIVDEMEFAESKNAGSGTNEPAQTQTTSGGFMNLPDGIDDEMPFR